MGGAQCIHTAHPCNKVTTIPILFIKNGCWDSLQDHHPSLIGALLDCRGHRVTPERQSRVFDQKDSIHKLILARVSLSHTVNELRKLSHIVNELRKTWPSFGYSLTVKCLSRHKILFL